MAMYDKFKPTDKKLSKLSPGEADRTLNVLFNIYSMSLIKQRPRIPIVTLSQFLVY